MVCPELVRVTDVSSAIVIASELIHCRPKGLGWIGKAHESKGFATPPTQPIRKRSEQTCIEAGSPLWKIA